MQGVPEGHLALKVTNNRLCKSREKPEYALLSFFNKPGHPPNSAHWRQVNLPLKSIVPAGLNIGRGISKKSF